jgi:hypothetical protein
MIKTAKVITDAEIEQAAAYLGNLCKSQLQL